MRSRDSAVNQMLEVARQEAIETTWDRFEAQLPQCGFGELGVCCRHCVMGPCRIGPWKTDRRGLRRYRRCWSLGAGARLRRRSSLLDMLTPNTNPA